MNKTIKRILSCLITLALTIGILAYQTDLFERKESKLKFCDFFNENYDYDVLYLGTSRVKDGFFPTVLWQDHGITSYNFGGFATELATSYWLLRNALLYKQPKIVVVDCCLLDSNRKVSDNFSFAHLSFDAFPTTPTKIRAIWDLVAEDPRYEEGTSDEEDEEEIEFAERNGEEKKTRMGLLWDYSVYHSRWGKLEEADFYKGQLSYYSKGADPQLHVYHSDYHLMEDIPDSEYDSVGKDYLEKLIEECQNRGIDVILTYLPFEADESDQIEAKYVGKIAQKYDVPYINFLNMDVINYKTDLCDKKHLNMSGAQKVSRYLGDYIAENYDVTDRREDEAYFQWVLDYDSACGVKIDCLNNETTDLETYLMVLYDDDYVVEADVRDASLLEDETIKELFSNIGLTEYTDSGEGNYRIKLTVYSKSRDCVVSTREF